MRRAQHGKRKMNQAQHALLAPTQRTDVIRMKAQLAREIECLERQLARLRMRDDLLDMITLRTYEEMIFSRQELLESLPWDAE